MLQGVHVTRRFTRKFDFRKICDVARGFDPTGCLKSSARY